MVVVPVGVLSKSFQFAPSSSVYCHDVSLPPFVHDMVAVVVVEDTNVRSRGLGQVGATFTIKLSI